jgi:hypothetical protein
LLILFVDVVPKRDGGRERENIHNWVFPNETNTKLRY